MHIKKNIVHNVPENGEKGMKSQEIHTACVQILIHKLNRELTNFNMKAWITKTKCYKKRGEKNSRISNNILTE